MLREMATDWVAPPLIVYGTQPKCLIVPPWSWHNARPGAASTTSSPYHRARACFPQVPRWGQVITSPSPSGKVSGWGSTLPGQAVCSGQTLHLQASSILSSCDRHDERHHSGTPPRACKHSVKPIGR